MFILEYLVKRQAQICRILAIVLLLIFNCITVASFAKNRRYKTPYYIDKVITGKVVDSISNPLSGVSITVKGTDKGVSTDASGQFKITVPSSKTVLIISFVGYQTKEVSVGNNSSIIIGLSTIQNQLSDVVVVGYGTQKKVTLTGSVVTAGGKELQQSPASNLTNSLVGRLPGLSGLNRSGEPGADASALRIRGTNTLGNSSPLIVVDGIANRSMDRIEPTDIESITVLKDASAAIYGAQAANGVILITTKRGRQGNPKITLNLNQGYNQPTRITKMANAYEYASMVNEINGYQSQPQRYSAEDLQKYQDGTDPWGHPNTNFFDATFKPWSNQNYQNLSISGGSEKNRYYMSVGTRFQDGNFKNSGSNYRQTDFRFNLDNTISKNINLSFDVSGLQENKLAPSHGVFGIYRGLMRGNPTLPAYWPDGKPGPDIEAGDNPVVVSTDAAGYDNRKTYTVQTNAKLNINIPWVKGLSIQGNASYDRVFIFNKNFTKPITLYTWDGQPTHITTPGIRGVSDPRLLEESHDGFRLTLNAFATYETTIATDHNIKVMAGTEKQSGLDNWFSAFRRNFISDRIDQLFAGGNDTYMSNNGGASQSARLNYFGRANYNYREKYLLEFVWRYDGSYIFAKGRQFGFFPGVSAGWRISEENFWKRSVRIFDDFKIRGSWGQTGNDRIAEYQYTATYGILNRNYVFGGNLNQIMYEPVVPNPNVTWEVANQANIGFDAQLLKKKLSVSFDYFNNIRSQILIKRNASAAETSGLTLPPENLGKVGNKGFEAVISYRDQIGKLNYNVSVNGGYAKNRVIFWDETPGVADYQKATGHPIPSDPSNINSDLYYQAIGIFKDQHAIDAYPHVSSARPGDVILEDVNKDGQIDGLDRVKSHKNNIPTFTGGFTVGLRYKQFDLSILIQGAAGAETYYAYEAGIIGNWTKQDVQNRWTPDNASATKSRAYIWGADYWTTMKSTYNIRNTDYVRLKNVEIGYALPVRFTKKVGIDNIRFYANGLNLFTLDKFAELDPEMEQNGNTYSYYVQRVVNAGLTLTF